MAENTQRDASGDYRAGKTSEDATYAVAPPIPENAARSPRNPYAL
jgi:hypothetical protein